MPLKSQIKTGEFGRIYDQFKKQPKKAILHLKKVRNGECVKALYRSDIGYIDIVWGENDSRTNKGFGLKHIIEKHGKEIKALGFEVEDFIPIIFAVGTLSDIMIGKERRLLVSSPTFRMVICIQHRNKDKAWLLTSFDLRKKPRK